MNQKGEGFGGRERESGRETPESKTEKNFFSFPSIIFFFSNNEHFQIRISYSPAVVTYRTHGSAWYPLFSITFK